MIPKNTYLDSRIPLTIYDGHYNQQQPSFLPKRQRKSFFVRDLDYLSVYTIAVNEEKACGGRIVAAPTNITTGTIPSVLKYYIEFISKSPENDVMEFLLTTAAIGTLHGATGTLFLFMIALYLYDPFLADDGCSMASAGFTAVMGGTVEQVETAAKIGMGLKCYPVAFQVPYIESTNLSAVKAIAVSRLALNDQGVSLDQVIKTMRKTGLHIMPKLNMSLY